MTRDENIQALEKMGVSVPDEWGDDRVEATLLDLQEAQASEPAPVRDGVFPGIAGGASPRG